MFGGPLHNPAFIETILSYLPELDKTTYTTTDRIEGMLSNALEETLVGGEQAKPVADPKDKGERLIPKLDPAEIDPYPFYFTPSALAKVLHCQAPPEADLKGALRHAGYKATRSHAKPGVIRTDAPWSFIWDMMREWLRQKAPVKSGAIKPNTAGWGIMHNTAEVNRLGMQFPRKETHNAVPAEAKATKQDLQKEEKTEKSSEQPRELNEATSIENSAVAQVAGNDVDGDIVMSTTAGGEENNKQGTAAPTTALKQQIIFDAKLGKTEPLTGAGAKQKRLVRYQTNPRANWGPMGRAKGGAAAAVLLAGKEAELEGSLG
jgi:tRNA (guanine26-N2/guanine27-N2)-dimethyltransferase